MRTFVVVLVGSLGAGEALAHVSVAAHEHPFGLSWLPGLELLVLSAILASSGWLLWRSLRRR
jgi:hypothetical protein